MPLQNRVTPLSELVADPARGLVYGNRGCLHDRHGPDHPLQRHHGAGSPAGWSSRAGSAAPSSGPGRFTELFFLDEATAMAAGHRACALCRRADYDRLRERWGGADAIDARLHAERCRRRAAAARRALDDLPDGAFVLHEGEPWLVLGDRLRRWTPAGTSERWRARPARARLITPPSLVELLRDGWDPLVPLLHPSA